LIVDKTVEWLGDSKQVIKSFPDDVKMDLGADLYRLQKGLEPNRLEIFSWIEEKCF
jgi:phage-related protein